MDHPGRQGGMMSADLEASKNCIQVPAKPDKANICMEMLNLNVFFQRWAIKKGTLFRLFRGLIGDEVHYPVIWGLFS